MFRQYRPCRSGDPLDPAYKKGNRMSVHPVTLLTQSPLSVSLLFSPEHKLHVEVL